METATRNRSLYERKPRLKLTLEELKKRNARLIALMEKWQNEGDAQEQKETGDFLMNALAEARESNREERS